MKQWKKLLPALLSLALLVSCGPKRPGTDTSVGDVSAPGTADPFVFTRDSLPRLDGSTSTAPMAQAMCAVLLGEGREQVADLVQFSRTTQSYRNLMAGAADLLLAAEPAPEVAQELKQEGEWLLTPFATDALVFVVNEDNPVDSLTTEQVRKIYTGQITNWKEVGGDDATIVVLNRKAGSGTRATFEAAVFGDEAVDFKGDAELDKSGDVQTQMGSTDNAISYLDFSHFDDSKFNAIKVEGVEPKSKNVTDDSFKIWATEHMYCSKDADEATKAFLEFMLSDDVQGKLVEEQGFIPVSAMKVVKDASGKVSAK